tara:strand:- start:293 stop:517 length:225 start_codon:yes stop_codon:yes gene_type:complete
MDLPPCDKPEKLRLELRLAGRHAADALQEAWVAHLEGRPVVQAVKTYLQREYRIRKRQKAMVEEAGRLYVRRKQ